MPSFTSNTDIPDPDEFWDVTGRLLRKGLLELAVLALAAWFCLIDKRTPTGPKLILIGALAYLIFPADVVPDVLPVVGFTDDSAVVLAAVTQVGTAITDEHRDRARDWVSSDVDEDDGDSGGLSAAA